MRIEILDVRFEIDFQYLPEAEATGSSRCLLQEAEAIPSLFLINILRFSEANV
jgi:hypothetical protein